ncbi:magnesium transporter [Candidatus Woesearchaeota archaeon]|nr:magnesium transporter [Candidatus Woesearchaeota archaeon]
MSLKHKLMRLRKVRKSKYHPLIKHVHKKHNISKRTLFYVKEYCTHTNVTSVIIRESLIVLIFASIISSFGGFGLEKWKDHFLVLLPILILFPVLNSMIGNYGIIFSSKYSTMLHEGKIETHPLKSKELMGLFYHMIIIGVFTATLASIFALVFAGLREFNVTPDVTLKIISISLLDSLLMIALLFSLSILLGNYIYKKKEDPNNFLIPILTSIADFFNIIVLIGLVLLFF